MFDNLNISDKCANALENAVKTGRLSHAVILEGADGDIRLNCAKELAKAIVCKDENKPCNICSSCIKANAGSHPDIHILEKDEKAATIKVDEIRALKDKAKLFPNDGDKSVFIISEAQFMGIQAQNALLKIFEEPSSFVNFILTCPSKSALLETIISRGSAYRLSNYEENPTDNEKIKNANELANSLLCSLCKSNEFSFLAETAIFQKDKETFALMLSCMIPILRDALLLSNLSNELISEYKDTAKLLCCSFTTSKLMKYIEFVQSLTEQLNASANYNLLLTRFCSTFYQIKNS